MILLEIMYSRYVCPSLFLPTYPGKQGEQLMCEITVLCQNQHKLTADISAIRLKKKESLLHDNIQVKSLFCSLPVHIWKVKKV